MEALQPDESVKPFACPDCSTRFTRQENLTRHAASVHRQSTRSFPCPQCSASFTRSDLRKRHLRRCYPTERASTSAPASSASPSQPAKPSTSASVTGMSSAANTLNTNTVGTTNVPPPKASPLSVHSMSWIVKVPQFLSAYFDKFHTILPVIHQPSFDATSAPQPLLQAVTCIGAVYVPGNDHHSLSLGLFEAGLRSLDTQVNGNGDVGIRETWVFQAYMLLEYFAIYSGEDSLFSTALEIHRRLVDASRRYQLLQDSVMSGIPDLSQGIGADPSLPSTSPDREWQLAIRSESRKRIMYSLYYLDSQLSICFNLRPLLAALEVKYELPCRDDIWSAPTAEAWAALVATQDGSFNTEDDYEANWEPRPPQGDIYSSLMQLMNPRPKAQGKPLGLLWHSSFTCLLLVTQIHMMIRDLTLGSTFLYKNIRAEDSNHKLSIVSESSRAQVMQGLDALADLMPQIGPRTATYEVNAPSIEPTAPWNHIWIFWHYAALSLTHQDGLLTSGIVEYSLPAAISTMWELGKPRSKMFRDVYDDHDAVRVTRHLTRILQLLTKSDIDTTANIQGLDAEDPFITMVAFKTSLMGWRLVRLVSLSVQEGYSGPECTSMPSIYTAFARSMMYGILTAMEFENGHGNTFPTSAASPRCAELLKDSEAQYLSRIEAAICSRDVWPVAKWIKAVFTETKHGFEK